MGLQCATRSRDCSPITDRPQRPRHRAKGEFRGHWPALGNLPLTKLTPSNIQKAYNGWATGGRRDGKEGPLAPRTRRHIHRISNSALARAVEQQVLARNPADVFRKRLPKVERKPMAVFTAEQSAEFLSAIKRTHTYWPVQEDAATRLDLAFGPAITRVSLASKKVQYQFQ